MNWLIWLCTTIYIVTFFFEGAVRYGLYLLGAAHLLYVRDGLLVLAVILLLPKRLSPVVDPVVGIAASALCFHMLVGLYYVDSPLQVLFGMKLYLPLFFGMAVYPLLNQLSRGSIWLALLLFICTAGGLFTNYFMRLPWEGFSYYVGGMKISGNLLWWVNDQTRLAGFARTSYDAAIYILASALVLMCCPINVVLRVGIWVVAGTAIWLTTTKGILLAYVVVTLFFASQIIGVGRLRIFQPALWPLVGLAILMPVLSQLFQWKINRSNKWENFFLGSYIDRIEDTWPRAFDLIGREGNYLLGRGVGGIGTPQLYWEPLSWNPADNIFVLMYGTFGIFALFYLVWFVWCASRLTLATKHDLLFFSLLLVLMVYGLTTGFLESGLMAILSGVCVAHVARHAGLKQAAPAPSSFTAPKWAHPATTRAASWPSWRQFRPGQSAEEAGKFVPMRHRAASTRLGQ